MTPKGLSSKAEAYLHKLCVDLPTRLVGSQGNRDATTFFADLVRGFGFDTETPAFRCVEWTQDGATLTVGGTSFPALVSPYSLGGQLTGPLAVVSTRAELEAASLDGRVVLLRGEIAREQLMPKNFAFYNPEEHQRIIGLLEAKQPRAIIAATGKNPEIAGALYPFPLIEDGDFDIPSVYLKDVEGERLAQRAGQQAELEVRAQRQPATGCNVIARKGTRWDRRVVVFAHIDAKEGTPGALDNAAGVAVLLLLAELLAREPSRDAAAGIELVALNGEDYYAAPGEMQWLAENEGRFHEILLGINIDGAGYREGSSAYSLYGCPPALANTIRRTFDAHPGLVEGEPWYQSDHGLFLMHQRPALALTSELFTPLWSEIAHTPQDVPELVDPHRLVEIGTALRDLLLRLAAAETPR